MSQGRSYRLPLRAIIATMQAQPAPVTLRTRLVGLPGYPAGPYQAELVVGMGRVLACDIRTEQGQLVLRQQAAMQALEAVGDLCWQLSRSQVPEQSLPREDAQVPHRLTQALTSEQQRRCSHRQIRVFALVDGRKSVDKIARLLHLSVHEVHQILKELQQLQLIQR